MVAGGCGSEIPQMMIRRSPSTQPGLPNLVAVLPRGVTQADWAREMGRWQNPRIKAFLGCLQMIQQVLESNFAILHCSPSRLQEMLDRAREVAGALQGDIALLLNGASRIPELEASRLAVRANLRHIEQTLLAELDAYPDQIPHDRLGDLRKFMCVAVGQLHRFLQDSFGSLMAADPRARHDADYYLSRQFPRDVEEAEWLYESVTRLEESTLVLDAKRRTLLTETLQRISRERRIPSRAEWADTGAYLESLVSDFAPSLKEVTALKGIRLEELDLLTNYAHEIPTVSRIIAELYESSLGAIEKLRAEHNATAVADPLAKAALKALHDTLCDRLLPQIRSLDDYLRDLTIFIPLWRRGISQRRALLLKPRDSRGATSTLGTEDDVAAGGSTE
jgi:hypothetical protein